MGLAVKDALLHNLSVPPCAQDLVAVAHLWRQFKTLHQRAHHQHGQTMHVEGESRGGVASGQLLGDQTVGLEVRAEPAVLLRDAQRQESRPPPVMLLLEWPGGVAVQISGPGA